MTRQAQQTGAVVSADSRAVGGASHFDALLDDSDRTALRRPRRRGTLRFASSNTRASLSRSETPGASSARKDARLQHGALLLGNVVEPRPVQMRYRKVELDRAKSMDRVASSFSRVEACQELRGQIAETRALVRHMRASVAEAQSLVAQSRAQLRDCYQLLSKVGSDSLDGLSPGTIDHENRGAEATEAMMALTAQLTR